MIYYTMAKEKAAKHMPVKMRRNWPIITGFIASSKAFMNLPDKELQIRGIKVICTSYCDNCISDNNLE
jgi:hypothetical protein